MDLSDLTARVEQVSQRYAERFGIQRDASWFLLKLHEEVGELTQAQLMLTGQARTKGQSSDELQARFGAEIADVLCQVLILAHHHEIDVVDEIQRKWLVHTSEPTASAD